MSLVVDASVWVSAADTSDALSAASRALLGVLAREHIPIQVPAHVHLEVACAMARRLRDSTAGQVLAEGLLRSPQIGSTPIDEALLAEAKVLGTTLYLRAGDALYLAVARRAACELVSWDLELIDRAGAKTPEDWLSSRAPVPEPSGPEDPASATERP